MKTSFFIFVWIIFRCKTINCCIKTLQRYALFLLTAIFFMKIFEKQRKKTRFAVTFTFFAFYTLQIPAVLFAKSLKCRIPYVGALCT